MLMKLTVDACILFLLSSAALLTVYSGWILLSLDSLITLGAYVFFWIFTRTHASMPAIFASLFIAALPALLAAFLTRFFKTQPLLSSLAFSLIIEGALRSLGGGSSKRLPYESRLLSEFSVTFLALSLSASVIFFLFRTKRGLYLRLSGENEELLASRGIESSPFRILSWALSAALAGVAGAFLCALVGSYSTGLSSFRGWLALCAALSGKNKPSSLFTVTLIFTLLQNFSPLLSSFLPDTPPFLSLSLPPIGGVILLFLFSGNEKNR